MIADTDTLVISVLHPTDFSEASDMAFEHALAYQIKQNPNYRYYMWETRILTNRTGGISRILEPPW